MAERKTKPNVKPTVKRTTKKRTLNPGSTSVPSKGAPFNHADPQRRLGNFESAGEHPRVGGRRSGVVGQTSKSWKTDKKLKH